MLKKAFFSFTLRARPRSCGTFEFKFCTKETLFARGASYVAWLFHVSREQQRAKSV